MQTPLEPPSPWPGRLAGGCFVISLLMLGCLAGVLVATRVFATSGMGWDQLADALGGAAVGALAGVAVGALLVRRLGARQRILLALLALAGAVLCLLYLRATPPRVAAAEKTSALVPAGETRCPTESARTFAPSRPSRAPSAASVRSA